MTVASAHRFLKGKHVVVFGAGYIGGQVARVALTAGSRVTVLTRNPRTAAELSSIGCTAVVDQLAGASWHDKISAVDLILNSVSGGGRGLDGYRESYLAGAESINQWGGGIAEEVRLIYTGSTSVYPQGDGCVVSESDPIASSDERTEILVKTEHTVANWRGSSRVLRLAGIYGPARHHLLDRLRLGETQFPGSGDHHLNLIHRDDAVDAIVSTWAQESDSSHRAFNVVDDGRARKSEIVNWLARRLGRAKPSFTGEWGPGRRPNRPDRILCNRRIKAELNWTPQYPSFKEGYAQILGA